MTINIIYMKLLGTQGYMEGEVSLKIPYNFSFIERLNFSIVMMAWEVMAFILESFQMSFWYCQNIFQNKPVDCFSAGWSGKRTLIVEEMRTTCFQACFWIYFIIKKFIHVGPFNMAHIIDSQFIYKRVTLSSNLKDDCNYSKWLFVSFW